MNTYDYKDSLFTIDPVLRKLRDYKEMYIRFNNQNAGKPIDARIGLDRLIDCYLHCGNTIFYDFANLLIRYHDYIINSFIMVKNTEMERSIPPACQMARSNSSTVK